MHRGLLIAGLIFVPAQLSASPVYVGCEWYNGQFHVHHDYTLDERRGTATRYVEEMDHSDANLPVAFTPDFVVIDEKNFHTRIDRRTLKYRFESYYPKLQIFDGQCQMRQAPARRF